MTTAAEKPLKNLLDSLSACGEAVRWAADYPDLASAWAACPRADWMLWLYGRLPGMDRKRLVLAACACAETSLVIYEARYPNDPRPRKAIETARAWTRNEATREEVRAAAAAADAASADAAASAYAAYAAASAYAADAAAYAYAADAAASAYAADAADAYAAASAYAAYAAASAYAADAAASAADAAAANRRSTRSASLSTMADLVRGIIPDPEARP